MTAPKNLVASVKARLLALAKRRGETFNDLLTRYGIERLLYRLSQSRHADRFLLRGAMLFVLWDDRMPRPTRDVDLLAFGPTEIDDVLMAFREIAETSVPADGLEFDAGSITAEEIREGQAYGGLRVRLMALLGKAKVPLQVDLGTGDAVTPEPVSAEFPALLDFPAPQIRAYPIYTVVAEKFEAMVSLGAANTRMKDFYDLRFLAGRFSFDRTTLRQAIRATFARRQTDLSSVSHVFADAFALDPNRQVQWRVFLARNGLSDSAANFAQVMREIREFIVPTFESAPGQWQPGAGWTR